MRTTVPLGRPRGSLAAARGVREGTPQELVGFPDVLPQKSEALVGFRGGDGQSGDEASDEGAEEGFAPAARVVHELEEAEVVRQLLLRDAPMRAEPRAQQ